MSFSLTPGLQVESMVVGALGTEIIWGPFLQEKAGSMGLDFEPSAQK